MIKKNKPDQIENVLHVIKEHIDRGCYRLSSHASGRLGERGLIVPDILYVLKTGYHEKKKISFCEIFNTWKYAIRGKTLDDVNARIIVSFDENDMVVITVINLDIRD